MEIGLVTGRYRRGSHLREMLEMIFPFLEVVLFCQASRWNGEAEKPRVVLTSFSCKARDEQGKIHRRFFFPTGAIPIPTYLVWPVAVVLWLSIQPFRFIRTSVRRLVTRGRRFRI